MQLLKLLNSRNMERKINSQLRSFQNKRVFFEKTPEVLLDNIARLTAMLENYRNASGPSQDILLFYEGILRILKMAYFYIQDTQFIHDRNILLESHVKFLSEHSKQLQNRLNEYETLTRLKLDNRLEEVMNCAEAYVQKVQQIHKQANSAKNANQSPT